LPHISLLGRISFDTPVTPTRIPLQLAELRERATAFTLTFDRDGALTGLNMDRGHPRASIFTWHRVWEQLESIAQAENRTLQANATWSGSDGVQGDVVVDAGGRLHLTAEADRRRPTPHPSTGPDASPSPDITISPFSAGSSTEFAVTCSAHGHLDHTLSHPQAEEARDRHLLDQHTPTPLPLGRTPAAERLLPRARKHLDRAAETLRRARTEPEGTSDLLQEARAEAAWAATLLALQDGLLLEDLVHVLIEQTAESR
jgi:hypothetical protein